MSQVVHEARAYPGFCGMKQLRVRVDDRETQRIAGIKCFGNHYILGWRETVRAHHNFFGWDLNHSIKSPAY